MTITSVDRHNLKFSAPESAHNTVVACSTSNDSLTFCNICATNGFPHESIRFVKVGQIIEEIVPIDGIVCKVIRRPKYFVYNHFEGGRHYHKYRSSGTGSDKQREVAA